MLFLKERRLFEVSCDHGIFNSYTTAGSDHGSYTTAGRDFA